MIRHYPITIEDIFTEYPTEITKSGRLADALNAPGKPRFAEVPHPNLPLVDLVWKRGNEWVYVYTRGTNAEETFSHRTFVEDEQGNPDQTGSDYSSGDKPMACAEG